MNILQSHRSKDKFILHEFDGNYPPIKYCVVCREAICGPYFSYKTFILHKSCAELPGEIQHPLHPEHPLRIHFGLNRPHDFICDGCQTFSPNYKYRCKKCNVKLDYQCISKHVEGQALKERVDKITDYHQHKLQLLYFPFERLCSVFCCCCMKDIEGSAYGCLKCSLFIHESCLDTIPKQVKTSFHPQHSLLPRILTYKKHRKCHACLKRVTGIELSCPICKYSFHVSCGKYIRSGPRLQDHEHKLLYNFDSWDLLSMDYDIYSDSWNLSSSHCDICHQICKGPIYRCIPRGIHFHVKCLLPSVLNHECHDHQLTLTSSVVPRGNASKYRCDVCEEEEDFEHYVYHCEECYFMAHIECLFFEEDNPPSVDSEQQIDEVQQTEDDQEVDESDVEGEESMKSCDEEIDETEVDQEIEESDVVGEESEKSSDEETNEIESDEETDEIEIDLETEESDVVGEESESEKNSDEETGETEIDTEQ